MAKATDLLAGHSARLGFGAVLSAAIGAYSYALLSVHTGWSPLLALIAAIISGCLTGLVLAWLLLTLDADGYLLATFALQMAVVEMANNFDFTGGPLGIRNIPAPAFFKLRLGSDVSATIMLIGTTAIAATILIATVGKTSRLGRIIHWVRDDDMSAATSGVNMNRLLAAECILHGMIGASAGIGIAISQGYVGPRSFDLWLSLKVFAVVVISGTGGSPLIMLIGSAIIICLSEAVSTVFTDPTSVGPFQQVVINCVLIFVLIFRQRGLAGPLLTTGPSARNEQ